MFLERLWACAPTGLAGAGYHKGIFTDLALVDLWLDVRDRRNGKSGLALVLGVDAAKERELLIPVE